jgi:hypothetical protein
MAAIEHQGTGDGLKVDFWEAFSYQLSASCIKTIYSIIPVNQSVSTRFGRAFTINSFRLEVLKSPFFKGGLQQHFLAVSPPFLKGGRGDYKASHNGKNFWHVL